VVFLEEAQGEADGGAGAPPPPNPELEALDGEAKRLDAPPAPGPEPGAAKLPQLSPAEEWAAVPAIFGRIVSRVLPEVKDIYTDKANLEWGTEMATLAERYGWTASKFFAWLGPWVGVGLATEALVTPTAVVIYARLKLAREEREKAKRAADAKPVQ
jgi:hypothetical protein